MQLHFKEREKKKRKPLGDFGGRVGNLKLTPKVFSLFLVFFFFFFFWKAVKCRERISGLISPPSQLPLRDFWEKVNCRFPQSCGGDVEDWGRGFRGTRKCLLEEAA